ncbi:MAG: HEPN domain-containing protein [Calditrichaeota bacterium]|nr:MAG: HEPN domain-containing protein [Calditrichota bacterium]
MKRKKKSRISDHIRQRTREWFRKAEHGMVFLEHAPFDIEDPPTDTAGKMAHMVAEYSLKAFLVLNKKRIPKTHDLGILLDECIRANRDPEFEELREDCLHLLRYKIELTYPGPFPEHISVDEARKAIEAARRIKEFVFKKATELGF